MLARVLGDATLTNLALLLALLGRYVWVVALSNTAVVPQDSLREHVHYYVSSWWLITGVALLVFSMNGFYTRSRAYSLRYKFLLVAQAVSLVYLVFSFLVFLGWDWINVPRSALLPAWGLNIVFMIGARVLHHWTRMEPEQREPSRVIRVEDGEKRILVIGGAGYIGSALLKRLLPTRRKVRLLDCLLYGTRPIQDLMSSPNLEVVQADFRQVNEIVKAMQGVDEVIHLGGIVGDPACSIDEDVTVEVNLTATRTIAEIAKGSGVERFIFASTCSVYGFNDEVLDERAQPNPVSLYARSKLASERVLLDMADSQFAPIVLRFATVYGFSGRVRFDLVVNLLTAKALIDGEITVIGGDQWRPFVHVDDAARGILTALEAPLSIVRKEIFNVGSNAQNFTIDQVATLINQRVPSAVISRQDMEGDPRNYRVDFKKVHRVLGFEPEWDVESGIDQIANVITSGGISDYRNIEYSNQSFLESREEKSSDLLKVHGRWTQTFLEEASGLERPPLVRDPHIKAS
jgi:nucleoside-diphosphate-sugar epimerase